MGSIIFHKYRNAWVFSTEAKSPSGVTWAVEPIHKIAQDDITAIKERMIRMLNEKPGVIPEPDYDDPETKRTIFAKAFGLRTYQEYLRETRCFYILETQQGILLEEWPRRGGGFLADDPLWKKEFAPDDFDGVIEYLVRIAAKKKNDSRVHPAYQSKRLSRKI